MDRQPKLMDFSRMRTIFEPHLAQIRENFFINNELGIVHGNPTIFQVVWQQKPPFIINDYRMGVFARGEALINFNLVEKHVTGGSLVFLGPGTIINPIKFSNDIEIHGIGLFADFPMPFATGQMPPAFNGQVRDFQIKVGDADIETANRIINTLWHVVHQNNYNMQTVCSLVAALMNHYDGLYRQHTDQLISSQSHEQTIFDRFIALVNQHGQYEHQISYYAERMCLTERYLGTIIRQVSGTTAKEWIDQAIITHIKIELRHTNKSITQIAEEMRFPNTSFFCKYFKRMTGMTTQAYRQSQ